MSRTICLAHAMRTSKQPQYYVNGAPVIACCFIIKGNLGPNGIHSFNIVRRPHPNGTMAKLFFVDAKKAFYLLRSKALFGMTKHAAEGYHPPFPSSLCSTCPSNTVLNFPSLLFSVFFHLQISD